MIPEHVKIGQRWKLVSKFNPRIEEVIEISRDRTFARVKVIQCLSNIDDAAGKIFKESLFAPEIFWEYLSGQDKPSE